MNFQEAFKKLEQWHGDHKRVAEAIGYTPEHYRAMRNGRYPMGVRAENAVRAEIERLERLGDLPCVHPEPSSLPSEARP